MKPLLVHESCRALPAAFFAQCQVAGGHLKRGRVLTTVTKHGTHFVTRLMTGELHLGPERPEHVEVPSGALGVTIINTGPPDAAVWGPPLWRELAAGAPTPEERRALAFGMLPRIPCGECRGHWQPALHDTPPEVFETAAAFEQWVFDRYNDIRRRKEKPEVSLEEFRARFR